MKERVAGVVVGWDQLISAELQHARATGELDLEVDIDIDIINFQLNAMLLQANNLWVLGADRRVFGLARQGIANLLEDAHRASTLAP